MARVKDIAPPVDREVVDALRARPHERDENLFAFLFGVFCQETPVILEAIERAYREGQADELEEYAHTLKGNAAAVGARRLHLLCAEVVDAVRDGIVPNAETLHDIPLAYAAYVDGV